jgi:hypothetical protein
MKPNVLAMHSNFNDLKLKNMEAKKWYENSKYLYSLDEHDEGGFLGIDDNKVAEMLEEYHQAKLKLLGIADVSKRLEWLEQQMDETPPFKQAYNNLNERHGRLIEAKNILDKEGLWL